MKKDIWDSWIRRYPYSLIISIILELSNAILSIWRLTMDTIILSMLLIFNLLISLLQSWKDKNDWLNVKKNGIKYWCWLHKNKSVIGVTNQRSTQKPTKWSWTAISIQWWKNITYVQCQMTKYKSKEMNKHTENCIQNQNSLIIK